MDDRLALMDQGSFLGLRALGHQPFFHATWTYDRPLDLDAVRRRFYKTEKKQETHPNVKPYTECS